MTYFKRRQNGKMVGARGFKLYGLGGVAWSSWLEAVAVQTS